MTRDDVATLPRDDVASQGERRAAAPPVRGDAPAETAGRPATAVTSPYPAAREDVTAPRARYADATTATLADPVLRRPVFSIVAPFAGWLAAWGAAVLAMACLGEAGVGTGFGFGIADGSVNLDTGFWAGLWTLVVQAGAFLFGGYVAGRLARVRAAAHALLAWFVAVLATAADAIVLRLRDGGSSVLDPLRLPHWSGLQYENTVAIPLAIFAVGALIGALLGGALAAGANRRETAEELARDGTDGGWLVR